LSGSSTRGLCAVIPSTCSGQSCWVASTKQRRRLGALTMCLSPVHGPAKSSENCSAASAPDSPTPQPGQEPALHHQSRALSALCRRVGDRGRFRLDPPGQAQHRRDRYSPKAIITRSAGPMLRRLARRWGNKGATRSRANRPAPDATASATLMASGGRTRPTPRQPTPMPWRPADRAAAARQNFRRPDRGSQVRSWLLAGGRWIRTVGPPYEGNDKRAECHIFKRRTGAEAQSGGIRLPIARGPTRDQPYRILPPPTSLFGDRPPRWGP
jgi:hypothetical protein